MLVIKEIAQQRFDICKTCENFSSGFTCRLCGCYMKFKVKLQISECPIGLWKKIDE